MPVNMFDASTPPATAPAGFSVVGGYLGGHTPHTWTAAEWGRFRHMKMLPIWVPGPAVNIPENATADAFAILEALWNLRVPHGSPVVLDMETSEAPSFDRVMEDILAWAGYRTWMYGSKDTIAANPVLSSYGGYWVADYTGVPHFTGLASERACQWDNGAVFDKSIVKDWQYVNTLGSW